MCHNLDIRFFQELKEMNPDDVCRRAKCTFSQDGLYYIVDFWGEDYEVYIDSGEIKKAGEDMPIVNIELGLAILFYLLRAKDVDIKSEWISEKDIPGGTQFFQGPHALPVYLIADRFGEDIEGFKRRCSMLGGIPLEMADSAFQFRILPRIPIAVLLWLGNDEFNAEAKLLFDRTISEHLPSDVIFGLSLEVCKSVSETSD